MWAWRAKSRTGVGVLSLRSPEVHSAPATTLRAVSTNCDDDEFKKARKWFEGFHENPLPKDVGQLSYSRSSGPGGQNVNKVNSKAQLRVSLDQLLPHVPPILHHGIRSSQFYAEKSNTLVFQADESRKQSANKDLCYRKLNQMLTTIYRSVVPGETSDEQKEKVKRLKIFENEARLERKRMLSNKKASRSSSFRE